MKLLANLILQVMSLACYQLHYAAMCQIVRLVSQNYRFWKFGATTHGNLSTKPSLRAGIVSAVRFGYGRSDLPPQFSATGFQIFAVVRWPLSSKGIQLKQTRHSAFHGQFQRLPFWPCGRPSFRGLLRLGHIFFRTWITQFCLQFRI